MPIAQVEYYTAQIRQLLPEGGHFHLKAWSKSNNRLEEVAIDADDYDLSGFSEVFWRRTPVQTRFFETLQRRKVHQGNRLAMVKRSIGRYALVCDDCGAIFDDRPRDKNKNVEREAFKAGWRQAPPASRSRAISLP